MKECENCGIEHDGKYGSGRFCSTKCSRGFSTKAKRKEINEKVSKTMISLGNGFVTLTCLHCGEIFERTWNRRKAKFCSKGHAIVHRNLGSTKSDSVKEKISKSVRKTYENGKDVYGGKTKWHQYKNIKVQGSYELRTCKILDKWKESGKIKNWEYTNDRIQYTYNGETSMYLLDFKVYENDGSSYYIETKGYQTDKDVAKWNEVRRQGYKLKVWFDSDIRKYE